MASDDFILVTRKRNKRHKTPTNIHLILDQNSFENIPIESQNNIIREINRLKEELKSSYLFQDCLKTLNEALYNLQESDFKDILCLGLGQFAYSRASKFQLAFLLVLNDHYHSKNLLVHDPIFSPSEVEILSNLGCKIHSENLEGKHLINQNTTLIFFPHCPNQLVNNYLYCNWSYLLNKSIIISNSFKKISYTSTNNYNCNISYIKKILPFTTEYSIFAKPSKYFDYFNDISIHIFPNLKSLDSNFWIKNSEPVYNNSEIELITTKQIPYLKNNE